MSRTPLVVIAGLLAASFACAPASAQTNPFGAANCKDARLDQLVGGNVVSSESVVVCKRAAKARPHQAAGAAVKPETPPPARPIERVAFNPGQSDRECAMLTCPTFILTGVGD
jgi:hypothetical protein